MAKIELTVEELRAAVAQKIIRPLYLLYGEEDFLAEEAADLIVQACVSPASRPFDRDVLYGGEVDARDVVVRASAFPMKGDRRVVELRETEKLSDKDQLSQYLEHPSPSTTLILRASKPDFRMKPFTTARQTATLVRCFPLKEWQIPVWIMARGRLQGRTIDAEAAKILAAYLGSSLREIQNELEKLFLFVGPDGTVLPEDVRAVVGVSKEFDVFELQAAIGERDASRATVIALRMLESGEAPPKILAVLTRYFLILWKLHALRGKGLTQSEMADAAQITPFYIKQYVDALERYPAAQIERAFEVMINADERLKSSPPDPVQVFHSMIVDLIEQPVAEDG